MPNLTELDALALRLLHEFGPLDTRRMAELLKRNGVECNPDKAYRILMRLTKAEKARHPKRCIWYAVGGRKPKPSTTDRRRLRVVG